VPWKVPVSSKAYVAVKRLAEFLFFEIKEINRVTV